MRTKERSTAVKTNRYYLLLVSLLVMSIPFRAHSQSVGMNGAPCVGNSINFFIQGSCSGTTWSLSGGSITQGQGTNSIRATFSSAGNYTVTAHTTCSGVSKYLYYYPSIAATVTPTVSLSLSASTVCQGTSITFTPSGTNGGTPTYIFYVDGVSKGSSTTFSTAGLSAGTHSAYVVMTSSLACVTSTNVTSSTQNFTVNAPVSFTVNVSGPSIVCSNSPSGQFNANPSNIYGTLTYQWYQGGSAVGLNSSSFNATNLQQGQSVYCVVTSNYSCITSSSVQSNSYVVSLTNALTPTVGVQVGNLSYCQGTTIPLTATGNNISGSPTYAWYANGTYIGASPNINWNPSPGAYTIQVNVTGIGGTCLTTTSASASSPPITIYSPTVAGTLGAITSSFCNNGSLTLGVSGNTGSVTRYMVQSQDNGGAWSSWTSTNSTPSVTTTPGVNRTYNFQAFVQNGVCAEIGTNIVSTTVYFSNSMGTLSTSTPLICSGSGSISLTLTSLTTQNASWQYQYSDDGGQSYTSWTSFSSSLGLSQPFTLTGTAGLRIYHFQVSATNNTCAPVVSNVVSVNIAPVPVASASNQSIFSTDKSSLTFSSTVGGTVFTVTPLNGTSVNVTGMATSPFQSNQISETLQCTDGVSLGTANFSVTTSVNGCVGNTLSPVISVYPLPVISSGTTVLNRGGITINVNSFYNNPLYTCTWYLNGSNIGTGASIQAVQAGSYQVKVTVSGIATPRASNTITISGQFDGQAANFIVENSLLVDNISPSTVMDALPATSLAQNVQYFDGLGRPIQTVATQASPTSLDLVSTIAYDAYGRPYRKFLPFTNGNNGWLQYSSVLDANQSFTGAASAFYTTGSKTAHDTQPYAQTYFESSPLNRPLQDFGPGSNWYTGNGGATTPRFIGHDYRVNVSTQENIYDWLVTSTTQQGHIVYLVTSNGSLPTNSLQVSVTTDENNHTVREYTDKFGRVIVRKIQATSTPSLSDDSQWSITYYVYDNNNRLRFVLQPQFTANISTYNSASPTVQTAMIRASAFQYVYDQRGRMRMKQLPGADSVEMVYDQWDRLRVSRDGNQRANGKWAFTKYDVMNRPIITGEYTSAATYATMASSVNALARYESPAVNAVGYTYTATFPGVAQTDILKVAYYDDYSFKTNLSLGTAYDFFPLGGTYPSGWNSNVRGKVTGTQSRGLSTSQWLFSVIYYDNRYRAIQTVSDDHLGNKDRVTNCYSGITDWVTKSQLTHGTLMTSISETDYDQSGRPTQTYLTMDSGPRVITSTLRYNELGQVVEKNLHSTDGTNYLQSVDYRYNIRGWLASINNSSLQSDNGTTNDDTNDLFGEQLYFEQNQTINGALQQAQFNGNISSVQWGTNNLSTAVEQKTFGFQYDPLNRLTQSSYATGTPNSWNLKAGLFNEVVTYDPNGNIKTLTRNSLFNSALTTIDQLTYTYPTVTGTLQFGNQLATVDDGSAYSNLSDNNPDYGFAELTKGITEYGYDANGNMKYDLNKGIPSITYNIFNKPLLVTLSNPSRTVQYIYDGNGSKLRKIAIGNGLTTQNDYVGGIQYVNNTLSFLLTPEGRAVKNGSSWTYEYFLKDHLGNTRTVFAYTNQTYEYKATMEPAISEQPPFQNITNTKWQDATYNHTPKSYLLQSPGWSAQVNGYLGKPIGPAITFNVNSNDIINASVYSKYTTGVSGTVPVVSGLATALINAFGIGSAEAAYSAFTNNVPTIAAGLTPISGSPKAYLIYLLFNSTFSSYQVGYQMVSSYSQVGFEQLSLSVTVPSGYDGGKIYVYVANETNSATASSVYFDDMFVQQIKSTLALQVTQTEDYYSFGMPIGALAYNKTVPNTNQYLYNGKELQSDFSLNWMDYGARMFMPEIGVWGVVDPLAEKSTRWSPYNYAYNNPIRLIDPDGMTAVAPDGSVTFYGYAGMEADGSIQGNAIENDVKGGEGKEKAPGPGPDCKCSSYDEKGNPVTYGDPKGELLLAQYRGQKHVSWENEKKRWSLLLRGDIFGFIDYYPNAIQLGGLGGGGGSATVNGIRVAIKGSGKINPGQLYTVYKGITANGATYWGMTKDFVQRAAQHGDRFVSITEEYINIGSKSAARGLEQLMIDAEGGLLKLENAINSISVKNPKLGQYYKDAIEYLKNLEK